MPAQAAVCLGTKPLIDKSLRHLLNAVSQTG